MSAANRSTAIWGPDATECKPERWVKSDTGRIEASWSVFRMTFLSGAKVCPISFEPVSAPIEWRMGITLEPRWVVRGPLGNQPKCLPATIPDFEVYYPHPQIRQFLSEFDPGSLFEPRDLVDDSNHHVANVPAATLSHCYKEDSYDQYKSFGTLFEKMRLFSPARETFSMLASITTKRGSWEVIYLYKGEWCTNSGVRRRNIALSITSTLWSCL
ncbi:hypothetical protein R3P38DRAFT_2808171 [Favolaschia claudopus]|uniref:Uncharacterized protein n=1 Tax=Favolaschia claudopus TaxID=2862362 RepID=A0AAV9ZGR5_9AGAR